MDFNSIGLQLGKNLLSPVILCFVLGIFSKVIHGGIKIPPDLYKAISIYLLMSIGLIGGHELSHEYQAHGVANIWKPALVTLVLGFITPVVAFCVMRYLGGLSIADSAGIAAHYGSTSAVTFIVAQSYATQVMKTSVDGYLPTLVTILECPGIMVALAIGAIYAHLDAPKVVENAEDGDAPPADSDSNIREALWEVLTGQSIMLMVGLMVIGFISTFWLDEKAFQPYKDFFINKGVVFRGLLCVFLLEMGLVVGERLRDLWKVGPFLICAGIGIPIFHGFLGALLGHWAGLSLGGCTVFAAIVSSASYIAAPPAVRLTLPNANPTLSMTASLAITFPFNIAFGIPLYYWFSQSLGAKPVPLEDAAAKGHALIQTVLPYVWG